MTKDTMMKDVKYLINESNGDTKHIEIQRLVMDKDGIPMWSIRMTYIRSRKYDWMEFSLTWQKDSDKYNKYKTFLFTRITNPAYNPKAIEDLVDTYIETLDKNPDIDEIE